MKEVSVIIATIDRPINLDMALTSYQGWDPSKFDVWVMDDSGDNSHNIFDVCARHRENLDLHLVKLHKADGYWRGPETAYHTGLALSGGNAQVITQEGVLVPTDLLDGLLRYIKDGHRVINIYTWSSHWHGHCSTCLCVPPDNETMMEWFKAGGVTTQRLFEVHGIPHYNYDHPMFYLATRDAWNVMNPFVPGDRPYGDTDGVLLQARKRAGIERLVPPDLEAYHIHLDNEGEKSRLNWCNANGEPHPHSYDVIY